MNNFHSRFSEQLSSYLKLRCGLGFDSEDEAFHLKAFDKYMQQRGYTGMLTQELALDFTSDNPNTSTNYRVRRYQVVRHFSDYLATFDPQTPRLDPKALRRSKARRQAHIYTDQELENVLGEARRISPSLPIRGVTLHAMVGLAASTGLRISEVVRLDKSDVDLNTERLIVRQTKFGKDRYVPLHETTLNVLRNYAAQRDTIFRGHRTVAFFINMSRQRFCINTVEQAFCKLLRRVGLRGPRGRGPCFHDLRHRFAVTRLVTWYKAGMEVQAMLPALATYMGHVHYSDTAYYLKATAELLGLAANLYHQSLRQKDVSS